MNKHLIDLPQLKYWEPSQIVIFDFQNHGGKQLTDVKSPVVLYVDLGEREISECIPSSLRIEPTHDKQIVNLLTHTYNSNAKKWNSPTIMHFDVVLDIFGLDSLPLTKQQKLLKSYNSAMRIL